MTSQQILNHISASCRLSASINVLPVRSREVLLTKTMLMRFPVRLISVVGMLSSISCGQ